MRLIPYRDVLLIKNSKSIWSGVIKYFLDSPYSHSEYVVDDWLTFGTDLRRPASIHTFGYNLGDIDVYRYKWGISDAQKCIIAEELQKATKLGYDGIEALFLGLGIKYKGRIDRYICISIILKAMETAGLLPLETYKEYRDFTVFTDGKYFEKVESGECRGMHN